MLDDTCYFAAVEDPADGALLCALLNHGETLRFISATAFRDSKRPITKKLLQRIAPLKILDHVGIDAVAPSATAALRDVMEQPVDVDWAAIGVAMTADSSDSQLSLVLP